MAFDFKKEYKELYAPKKGPSILEVPPMHFVAVRGSGDPNDVEGAYQRAISVLYAISYTIKMSKKGSRQIDGYVDFVVPPLEGFWWQDGIEGADYTRKEFGWAVQEATKKKKVDCSVAEYLTIEEGLCVQCLHIGSYDDEPATVEAMHAYARECGYSLDLTQERRHHEIYLSDARIVAPGKLKTIIRHPIKASEEKK